ncbi:MAG TPA: DUF1800 family protein, partial [Candidatus Dormibacteraeota bacterium]|nr:DUF1800 family protein [Candidatus Dormibacteraeota bacterium]
PRIHDGGVKTFLGRTGNLGLEEVVDTILATSAAPLYISRRLWSFFAYPGVDDATLKPVVDAYHRGGGDVREMIGAILTHPAFYSTTAYRGIVKSPTELVVGLIRQHGLPVTTLAADAGDAMGQALFDPPDVAGWPGGPSWLNTGSWMARMRYLEAQTRAGAGAIQAGFTAAGATTAEAIVDRAAGYMVDGALTPAARDAIVAHVRSAGGTTAGAAADAVFLVGATPEHQLS